MAASSSLSWNQCIDVNFSQGHALRASSQSGSTIYCHHRYQPSLLTANFIVINKIIKMCPGNIYDLFDFIIVTQEYRTIYKINL